MEFKKGDKVINIPAWVFSSWGNNDRSHCKEYL